MKVLITAGPTREYIDSVRFISNASSGRMGISVADAALGAGCEVVLLLGAGRVEFLDEELAGRITVESFTSVDDLKTKVQKHFDWCDVLVMAAAVGDFKVTDINQTKLSRKLGKITLELVATDDVIRSVAKDKRADQKVVAFAVEDGPLEQIENKARTELKEKNADIVVVNTPDAMAAKESLACILSEDKTLLKWDRRSKDQLAGEIVNIINN